MDKVNGRALTNLKRLLTPNGAIFDRRSLQPAPESGERVGYNFHKRKNGSNRHTALDILGHLLAVVVTPANEQERAQVTAFA